MVPIEMMEDSIVIPGSDVANQAMSMLGTGSLDGKKSLKGNPYLYLMPWVCSICKYGFKFLLLVIVTGEKSTNS